MNITTLLLTAFSAIVVENVVFTQFLGVCPFLAVSKKPSAALGMGVAVTFVLTLSSLLTHLLYYYLLVPLSLTYMTNVVFLAVIATQVQLIEMFLKKKHHALFEDFGIYLPLITTNCAILGVILLNIQNGFNLLESIVYGFSSAIGFTLAILIFAGVRERIAFSAPSKSFDGLPIVLVGAGLVAMAFAGFYGINLG